jgi:hypothetical protein
MGSVMDQERPWERDAKPEGATLRERIKDVLRDKNSLHATVEQIVCELERLESLITSPSPSTHVMGSIPAGYALVPIEPTQEMVDAAEATTTLAHNFCEADLIDIYKAMVIRCRGSQT